MNIEQNIRNHMMNKRHHFFSCSEDDYDREMSMREAIVTRYEEAELPRAIAQGNRENIKKLQLTISLLIHQYRVLEAIDSAPELAEKMEDICPICQEAYESSDFRLRFTLWNMEFTSHWGCQDGED